MDERLAKLQARANQGDPKAQCNFGVYYYVNLRFGVAVEWFRKAADQGYALAQRNLGVCYANGHGVEKDLGKALSWFTPAAQQGDFPALSYASWVCSTLASRDNAPEETRKNMGIILEIAVNGLSSPGIGSLSTLPSGVQSRPIDQPSGPS